MLDGLRRACRSAQLAPHALEDELIRFRIIDLMSSSLCHTVSISSAYSMACIVSPRFLRRAPRGRCEPRVG